MPITNHTIHKPSNTNTSTTQSITTYLPDITSQLLQQTYVTAQAGRPSTPAHPITYLYSPLSVYITRPKQLTFPGTITNYQKAD